MTFNPLTTAFVFPGQGSQTLGMGKELADNFASAKAVFEEVNDVLNQDLSAIMWGDDEAALTLTENAQPAIMACSMAVFRVLTLDGKLTLPETASYVAGHSLGEYSAICAADVITLKDTAKALKTRGQAMQKAVPVGQGAMAAILGLEFGDVEDITKQASDAGICEIANDNSVGQVVISGSLEAIEKAIQLATDKGAKRALKLPVSAPFHCSLMQPAALKMQECLNDINMQNPIVSLQANVTAQPTNEAEQIKELLIKQVTGRVRWRESILNLKEQGINKFVEIGSGKVLSGLIKRIDRELECANISSVKDLEEILG